MKRILYVPFDQLHRRYGILKNANPQEDLIVMVESKRMTTGDQWHKVRLYFLISSARHFAEELKTEGFTVHYVQAETTEVGLKKIQESENLPIYACEQSSYRLTKSLENLGATFLENDFFLTPRKLFFQWAEKQKSFVMENFYRAQRIRLNILVEGEKPVGGDWNFDKENRLPPPKNYTFPPYLVLSPDSIDTAVAHQLHITPPTHWATSRSGALKVLKNFLDNHFAYFGPYEDAMTTENWALHHSLLSPYINNGLLHPSEVIAEALKRYKKGDIPIASCEGFIRQIIGWR